MNISVKKGMKVLVVGLGKSGVAAAQLLCKKGCQVVATDEKNKTDIPEAVEVLSRFPIKLELGKHVLKTFTNQDLIVVSPGVPLDIKPLKQARKAKVPIIGEVELASYFIRKPIVAITGTNGKTTTAHLLAYMIEQGGKKAFLCGNVGRAMSEYGLQRTAVDFVVAEVSSFQLESCYSFKPDIAIFLNIAPDHLDRYETYDDYIQAKMRLKANMTEKDHIILNARDEKLLSLLLPAVSKKYFFSSDPLNSLLPEIRERFEGIFLESPNRMCLRASRWKEHIFSLEGALLRGLHNRENIMAAALAAKLLGISNEAILKGALSFKGLPHRMEFVARKNQVNFVNDSKGTNVHALARALESFDRPVILIAGGKDKKEDFSPLAETVKKHVKNLILVGEAKEKINRAIGDYSETYLVGTFEEAVFLAYQKAKGGDTILLSPGCASQDMFQNFEHRGERFKQLVSMFN